MPNFSGFHEVFRDHSGAEPTPEGDVRRAFYLSYDDTNCEYLTGDEVFDKLDNGIDVVSATFVTPYPPGFPVLVPGQVFSREILTFIRDLDTPEIHGYKPEFGYRVYTQKAIEMCGPVLAPTGGQAVPRGGEAEPIVEPGPSALVLTQTVPSSLAVDQESESGVSDEAASSGTKSGTATRKARSQRERGGDE